MTRVSITILSSQKLSGQFHEVGKGHSRFHPDPQENVFSLLGAIQQNNSTVKQITATDY